MKYDVFISYRREGGAQYARTIQQALEGKQYHVFLDFDELKDGVFDQRIIDAINDSSVFLLILSKGALDRCVNEGDWVRQEILQAMKCGCHIVPVNVDDTFEGVPDSLPEELRRALKHQFSELQMKTLFKASMEQLVRDRIAPYVKREDDKSGVEIHIEVDADCDLFRFKTFIRQLKAGEDNVIYLKPGKYKLEFVSAEFPEVRDSKEYKIEVGIECDFMEISLQDKVEDKRKAEEEARRKAEEEAKRKEEEEHQKKLKALENIELKPIKKDGKWGFADESGKVVIPRKRKNALHFSEDWADVEDDDENEWEIVDKTGEVVIPRKRKNALHFSEGWADVEDDDENEWEIVDKTDKVVIPRKRKNALHFSKGWADVEDDDGNEWEIVE